MSELKNNQCPLCAFPTELHCLVDGVEYFECADCDFIFADNAILSKLDGGLPIRQYDNEYWEMELRSARERSYGSSLARLAEAVLYCRIPIKKFVDIGTGPGYLLDAVSVHLPSKNERFYGFEKYPPQTGLHSGHPNYRSADLADAIEKFECGVCIEVLEHLTPRMAKNLAEAMRRVSVEGSLFLFNTGLTDYVRKEDPGYLDPYGRGHITCWSITAARKIFEPSGFQVSPLRGKSWAFVIERSIEALGADVIEDRIWRSPMENVELLHDEAMGSLLYILGRESARAY